MLHNSQKLGYKCDLNCKEEAIYVKQSTAENHDTTTIARLLYYNDHDDMLRFAVGRGEDYQEAHRDAIRKAEKVAIELKKLNADEQSPSG